MPRAVIQEKYDSVGCTSWLPWLTALALGAALMVLAVLLYYRMGGQSEANIPLRWSGADMHIMGGQGTLTPAGLEIPSIGSQGIVLWMPSRRINAGVYSKLAWKIVGLDGRHPLQLLWRTVDGQVRQAAQATVASAGQAPLRTEPEWQGAVLTIGVFIPGPYPAPVTVNELKLRPARLTTGEWWNRLWEEWTTREDWSQGSINFAAGATSRPLGSLTLLAAIWVGFSAGLYAVWILSAGRRLQRKPFVALFLLGWLLLDMRWQWELAGRAEQTLGRFAGKDETERRLADLDGDLYRFLLEVRQRLPERPVRLWIIAEDRIGFAAGRAHYHLLPHNSYVGVPSELSQARPGDYVLLLAPLPGVRYVPERQTLDWGQGQLSAEAQYTVPAGTLLHVREPGG